MTRIAGAEIFVHTRPIRPRVGVSIAWASRHEYVLVRLSDQDGQTGWGETYLMPGLAELTRDLARPLIGKPAHAVRQHRETLAVSYAASALHIALDDLRAKQCGVPLHQLYGGERDAVLAYAASPGYLEGRDPEDTWPDEVAGYEAQGFTAIKLRIGRYGIDREAAILRRIRETTEVALAADGNGAYTMADAARMGDVLAGLGFLWFEEPLPQRGYHRYPELARKLRITLAAGELLEEPDQAARLFGAGGVDLVQPDPVICGGVGGLLRIADLAAMHGIPVVPHTSGGAIGIVAAIHAIACLPGSPLLELGRGDNPLRTEVASGIDLESGRIPVPTGPGLGIEIDEEYVRSTADAVITVGTRS